MALVPVTHKPQTAQARQFDGSLGAFLDIIQARPQAGVVATISFDDSAQFARLQLSGGTVSGTIDVAIGDWAIFPDDVNETPFSLTNAQATQYWQA